MVAYCYMLSRLAIIPGVRARITNEMELEPEELTETVTHIKGDTVEELSNDGSIDSLPPLEELGDSPEIPSLTESQHEMVLQQLDDDDTQYT